MRPPNSIGLSNHSQVNSSSVYPNTPHTSFSIRAMPAVHKDPMKELKRQISEQIFEKPVKGLKHSDSSLEANQAQARILLLENQIIESRKNYNSINILIDYCQHNNSQTNEYHVSAVALCRIFCRLMARGSMSKANGNSENEVVVVQWLRERMEEYERILSDMVLTTDEYLQSTALKLSLRLLKEKASYLHMTTDMIWRKGLFLNIIQKITKSEMTENVLTEYAEKYIHQYDDIRYYTFAALA